MIHTLLAARTHFSLGESTLTIEKLIDEAKAIGAKAVAVTDTMSVTALIELTNKAKKAGIKPIVGCRLRLVDDPTWRKPKGEKAKAPPEFFLTWYCRSAKGLEALFKLLSLANSDDRFYNNAKLGWGDLYDALDKLSSDDVAIASSDALSALSHARASEILFEIKTRVAPSSVFLTLTPANTPYWDRLNQRAILLGDRLDLSYLVSYPTCYQAGGDGHQEVMQAIVRNVKLTDLWHWQNAVGDFHPHSQVQLIEMCKSAATRLISLDPGCAAGDAFKRGLLNTEALVDSVTYTWSKAPISLPIMAADEVASLISECTKGWDRRFKGGLVFGHKPTPTELKDLYLPRLRYELSVLKELKFAGYFLLVQDIVMWSKSNGIAVGPGRGSVGGSLVAYLLGITECDPIRFGLLFERFINPGRVDLPDADLDFMSARREEVIAYIRDKWGEDKVAGISNYQVLGASSAIRDVGRVSGLSNEEVSCSKFVPKAHGIPLSLDEAADAVPAIAKFRDAFPPVWNEAAALEGVMRSLGRHAAGVVVSGVPLIERAVVERRSGEMTICWDKRIVEDQGLVKMDILGLTTLDLTTKAVDYIRRRHRIEVNLDAIPLDDAAVLDAFAQARTTGVFQFEGGGMKRMLRDLGTGSGLTFDEVVAVTALYRPGPMDSNEHTRYIGLKHGLEEPTYDHPLCQPALEPTYGVMTYQEQVMQLTRDLAGFTFTEADNVRKAMGKKDKEKMDSIRESFLAGCAKNGIASSTADTVWGKMAVFAGYGFNKSHGVEYTLISFQSMWLKVHYPVEFFAAALSVLGEDKLEGLVADASTFNISVLPPDINLSAGEFVILDDKTLVIPFNRCKGLSDNTTRVILEAREAGPFSSKAEFISRVNRTKCNIKHQAILDKVGAFANIEPGQLPPRHSDRLIDQRELLPGLVVECVPIARTIIADKLLREGLAEIINECHAAHNGTDGIVCRPTLGKKPRFMVITDDPTWAEEREGQIATGMTFEFIQEALDEAGLSRDEGYWTAFIKRRKAGKQLSTDEIARYVPYLQREIETLKPPLILCLGASAAKAFVPSIKGNPIECAGKVVYDAKLDANIVVGFNPAQITYDADKQLLLNAVFQRVADLSH